jgi:transcription factor MBP1
MVEEDDFVPHAHYPSSRKRKRALEPSAEWSKVEEEHRLYADALLDYFVLHEGDGSRYSADPPEPPKAFQVDRAIDTQGHTALHWAAAMGDVSIIKDLISRGANIMARNVRGETPLIRACLFANCYEKGTMAKVVHLLRNTITIPDKYGGTVFHHVAYTAHSNAKTSRARYYLELLLNKLSETVSKTEATKCLNSQDHRGDTAFHIAARYSKRCVRVFQGAGVASDMPNNNLETVEQILQKNVKQYKNSDLSLLSSSPIMADMPSAMSREPRSRSFTNNVSFTQDGYQAQTSHDFSMSFGLINQKAQDLVEAGEAEVQQMNAVLADAERLLQMTSTEGAVVQQRLFQLKALDEDVGIDHLQEEDVLLVRQAEAMQEFDVRKQQRLAKTKQRRQW